MQEDILLSRISINPNICFGKPCIKNTRIPIYLILELLEEGATFDEIIRDYYPNLTKDDIRACIHYANSLVKNEEIYYFEKETAK